MDCDRVRDQLLDLALASAEGPAAGDVVSHVEACAGCRAELEALREAWTLLGRWAEAPPPSTALRTGVLRAARRRLLRESVLTLRAWAPAAWAAAVGVVASLALSVLVPYALLVAWCRQALEVSDSPAAPYLVAGAVYGIPVMLGAWLEQRRAGGGSVIRTLETSALFLLVLAPYVLIQCREFAAPLLVAFVFGLGLSGMLWAFAGLWFARLATMGGARP